MPALLTLDTLSAATPDGKALFSGLTLSLGEERLGLVGRNGSGKSTLLDIIAGKRVPSGGTLQRHGSVALLGQERMVAGSVAEALGIGEALAILNRLEDGAGSVEDAASADWTLSERLDAVLRRLGLDPAALDRPLASLSGGEAMRVALAAQLLSPPDLLLLDEPTNNLDAAGRAIVGDVIARWPGAVIVSSHDRDLLDKMDRIVHLSPVETMVFTGNWHAFVAARDAARDRAAAELDRAGRSLDQQRVSVQQQSERKARRDKAGKARGERGGESRLFLGGQAKRAEQSGGRERTVGRRLVEEAQDIAEAARLKVEVLTPLHIALPPARLPAGRILLQMDGVALARGGRSLFGPLSLTVSGPERIAIDGPNGSGKTSFLALVTGARAPDSGTVWRREGAMALLDQHVRLLDPALDLVANMRAHHPGLSVVEAHALLARFAFRNRDALRPVATLSGGEKLRAGLAVATAGRAPPQMLVLDEPTNHLDLDAVEMLEAALAAYDGALLIVSHDRRFLEAVGIERTIGLGAVPD